MDRPLVVNGAPTRLDRRLPARDGEWAPVDGRSAATLLAFAPRFGRLVRFYDLEDRADGDWEELFLGDLGMLLATLAAADLAGLEAAFLRRLRPAGREASGPGEAAEVARALARQAGVWLRGLRSLGGSRLPEPGAAGGRLARLFEQVEADAKGVAGDALRRLEDWREGADLPSLEPLFYALYDAVAGWAARAAEALSAAAAPPPVGSVPPQIALYAAFVQLFARAQATVNTFAGRYARFYYRDVLRESEGPAAADSVYLAFALAEEEGVTRAAVPRGTLFSPGQGALESAILFAADRDLLVTAARLASVYTLRTLHGPLLEPFLPGGEGGAELPLSAVLASEIRLGEAGGWATFGPDGAGASAAEITDPAALGFAVASPYLFLTGGERTVSLAIEYSAAFRERVLAPRLAEIAAASGLAPREAFHRLLAAAFALYLSTAAGWLPVEAWEPVLPEGDGPRLGLHFVLPPSVPAIVAWDPADAAAEGDTPAAPVSDDPAVTATDPAPTLPTLKVYLRQEPVELAGPLGVVRVAPLALLGGLDPVRLRLHTTVRGLAGLAIGNTDGAVDPTLPFPVFGALPAVGSFLALSHRELFVKTPATLAVGIDWYGLPRDEGGFAGYYRDYVLADGAPALSDNAVFHGRFRVLQPGLWTLGEPGVEVPLFRTHTPLGCQEPMFSPVGPLCGESLFEALAVQPRPAGPPPFYDPDASVLRLELTAPFWAFGNDLYTRSVLAAVLEDLRDFNPPPPPPDTLKLRYPNPPWLPQARGLTVDYTAGCTLPPAGGADGQIFHLLPLGGVAPLAAAGSGEATLLPDIENEGQLLLGFTGLVPSEPLTLLFQLEAVGGEEPAPAPVAWEILDGDRWRRLAPGQVVADTTGGLQATGVVALDLPAVAPADGTRLPGDRQWLRAVVAERPGRFPQTLAITPHVATATRQAGLGLDLPLPAGTLTTPVEELPDIGAVAQPLPSWGGRPAETAAGFEVRLAERLRHKDRASLGWDYERLVLERFPEIWQVAALPVRCPERGDAPGNVLLVVVHGPDGLEAQDPTVPRAPAPLLQRIREEIERRASPFVRLHVVNPVYVRVEVRASVVLSPGAAPGADLDRLNDELVRYLSPWFDGAARARREGHYDAESDIADFIATRPYVEILEELELAYDPDPAALEWCYLTSAPRHRIRAV